MSDLEAGRVWAVQLPVLRAVAALRLVVSAPVEAAAERERAARSAGKVAVIPILGMLSHRWSPMGTSLKWIEGKFRAALADRDVSAIVLEVDSPGGEVYKVEELADEIRAGRKVKPIVASVNSLAASAAYWLASQASEVIQTPSGESGSVGVYTVHEDWSRALDETGVAVTLISAGEGKTAGSPYAPLTDEELGDMRAQVERFYGAFVGAVARGRGKKVAEIRETWKAKVYGAVQAQQLGLVDSIGTFEAAVARAGRLARDRAAVEVDLDVRERGRR